MRAELRDKEDEIARLLDAKGIPLPAAPSRAPPPAPSAPSASAEPRETSMLRELEHLRARAASLEQQNTGQAARVVELEAAIRTMTSALEEGSNMTKLVHAQIEQVLREARISEEARMAALQNTFLGEKAEAEAKMEEYRAQTQQRIERIERELSKVSAALSVHARALCVPLLNGLLPADDDDDVSTCPTLLLSSRWVPRWRRPRSRFCELGTALKGPEELGRLPKYTWLGLACRRAGQARRRAVRRQPARLLTRPRVRRPRVRSAPLALSAPVARWRAGIGTSRHASQQRRCETSTRLLSVISVISVLWRRRATHAIAALDAAR